MKVHELIHALQQCDPDCPIGVPNVEHPERWFLVTAIIPSEEPVAVHLVFSHAAAPIAPTYDPYKGMSKKERKKAHTAQVRQMMQDGA